MAVLVAGYPLTQHNMGLDPHNRWMRIQLLANLVQRGEDLSMTDGFNRLFGGGGTVVSGVLGLCSGLATVNVYTASVT